MQSLPGDVHADILALSFEQGTLAGTAMPWRQGGGLDYSFRSYKSLLLVK